MTAAAESRLSAREMADKQRAGRMIDRMHAEAAETQRMRLLAKARQLEQEADAIRERQAVR